MRRYVGLTGLVVVATLAGCGGSDEPTAEQRRAAKARWVQHVDAACRKANDAIADRGWPADLVDLDRLVVRGIDDARAAIRTIARERLPEGAGPQPGAFVRELKALDPELTKLSEASEDLAPGALVKAAEALKPRLVTVEKSAEAAGVSDCLSHDERTFIPDAVRAPVFAEQLAKLDRSLLRKMKSVDFAEASTPGEFAHELQALQRGDRRRHGGHRPARSAAVGRRTDRQVPGRAARAPVGQPEVHDRARRGSRQADHEHRHGEVHAARQGAQKAGRREIKTRRKMLRAVGAGPTTRPAPGGEAGEAEPESEEQS